MACYYRFQLQFEYNWNTQPDDPRIKGEADNSFFNRNEGWEVLYMINKYCQEIDCENVELGQKVERVIRDYLPAGVRTQKKVLRWLDDNRIRHGMRPQSNVH